MSLRPSLTLLHRYVGLVMAPFLFVAGLTGAVISWDHELDEWLNPQLFIAKTAGTHLPVLELAKHIETSDPRIRVKYMPLTIEAGDTLVASVELRIDPATGKLFDAGYNQVAVDPATGAIQGKRDWGAVSLSRENLLPFLYKLHYSLHIPSGWGYEFGILLMGIIGIGWVIDCIVSLSISFPNLNAWRKSLAFRWREGGYRLNFDLHRSGGVWLWLLLLMLAVTSVSMNLQHQVMRPVVSMFSTLSSSPFSNRTPPTPDKRSEPTVTFERAIALAEAEAKQRGWTAPAGAIFLSSEFGLYGVGFYERGKGHGDGGLGNPWLYLDSHTGEAVGATVPGTGTNGDIFMQAMFPLHSGRIIGLPGRILISLLGLAIAVLCVTGVLIWLKKRRARLLQEKKLIYNDNGYHLQQ